MSRTLQSLRRERAQMWRELAESCSTSGQQGLHLFYKLAHARVARFWGRTSVRTFAAMAARDARLMGLFSPELGPYAVAPDASQLATICDFIAAIIARGDDRFPRRRWA